MSTIPEDVSPPPITVIFNWKSDPISLNDWEVIHMRLDLP
jgi:hypothetical protein